MPDTKSIIQDILVARAAALGRKDAEAALAYLSEDAVSFDLDPPLQHRGLRPADLQAWFDTWQGPLEMAYEQLHITHGEEVAFARFLSRLTGIGKDGQKTDLWHRSTVCLERSGETWKIVHEHHSVPFLMDGSNLAALDLKP